MRKSILSISEVKSAVCALSGKKLKICVNRGRKKIDRYYGEIMGVYPAVFILKIEGNDNLTALSCSYNDVICGDVKLKEREKKVKSAQ